MAERTHWRSLDPTAHTCSEAPEKTVALSQLRIDDIIAAQNDRQALEKLLLMTWRKHQSDELRILMTGKAGQGKSTLVNGLVGYEIAKERATCTANTSDEVTTYSMVVNRVKVTVFDSPGLLDDLGAGNEEEYIRNMTEQCQQLSLVLYCMKMTNLRLTDDDRNAMKKLTQAFGESIWEYSVIVLTFANEVDCSRRDDRDQDTGPEPALDDEEGWKALEEKRFKGRLKIREEELKHFLTKEINVNPKIVKSISVVPVGDYRKTKCNQTPYHLPDRDNWFNTFWERCCLRTKDIPLFLQINEKRIVAADVDVTGSSSSATDKNVHEVYHDAANASKPKEVQHLNFQVVNSQVSFHTRDINITSTFGAELVKESLKRSCGEDADGDDDSWIKLLVVTPAKWLTAVIKKFFKRP